MDVAQKRTRVRASLSRLIVFAFSVLTGAWFHETARAQEWDTPAAAAWMQEALRAFRGASVAEPYGAIPPTIPAVAASRNSMSMAAVSLPVAPGHTVGSFAVSPTGAATYSIPIWIPPGARGIEPKLALVYNSFVPNGLLGVGWSVSGLGAITRCPANYALNSQSVAPMLVQSDRFCLQGQQLRLVSGTYGTNGSTYGTEMESFAQVILHGAAGTAGSWWEVKDKDGLIYDYGNSTDSYIESLGSTIAREWALTQIRDRIGNSAVFKYVEDTASGGSGSYRPDRIEYTHLASQSGAYYYQVKFTYEARATAPVDVLSTYQMGGLVRENNRLASIQAQFWNGSTWAVKRTYQLAYDNGPVSSRTRLRSVQECDATTCLNPTAVNYQNGSAGVSGSAFPYGTIENQANARLIDINRDGRSDLIYPGASTWKFMLSNGNGGWGLTGPYDTGISVAGDQVAAAMPIDFNGDGFMDLLVPHDGSPATWHIIQSNGSSFSRITTSVSAGASATTYGLTWIGDVNGDGLDDVIYAVRNPAGQSDYIYWLQNFGGSLSSSPAMLWQSDCCTKLSTQPFGSQPQNMLKSPLQLADFNGDGRVDLIVFLESSSFQYWQLIISSSGSSYVSSNQLNTPFVYQPMIADLNADGCSDLVYVSYTGGPWTFQFSNCQRNYSPNVLEWPITASGSATDFDRALISDYDGDGRLDLLIAGAGPYYLFRFNGSYIEGLNTTNITLPPTGSIATMTDMTGDGLPELVYLYNNSPYIQEHSPGTADLVTSIVDAYGVSVSFDYRAISQPWGCYGTSANTPPPNGRFYGAPLHVACTVTVNSGLGPYTLSYYYSNAAIDRQGRGFLGFEMRMTTDNRTGVQTQEYYRQSWPYIGMKFWTKEFLSTKKIREIYSTPDNQRLLSPEYRYITWAKTSVDDLYEVGGPLDGQLITRTTTTISVDTYGNPTRVTVTATDQSTGYPFSGETYTTDTVRTITNDATNWCLNHPTNVTVTQTIPGGASVTHTSAATVDYVLCRNTQEIAEPGNSTQQVVKDYGFDACGNVSSITMTGKTSAGASMPVRTTSTNFGTRCQFAETSTNAENEVSATVYDYGLGLPISQADPNGIAVTSMYDGYGRTVKETRPDGTYTQFIYADCGPSPGCSSAADLRSLIRERQYDAQNNLFREDVQWQDGLDRQRFESKQTLVSGQTVTSATSYDLLGRRARDYMPSTGTLQWYHQYSYDLIGRPTGDALYDGAGLNRQVTMTYAAGSQTQTDARNNATTKYTDLRGKLRRIVDPSPGGTTNYGYDPDGNLTAVTDAISATSTQGFNLLGYKVSSSDADAGSWLFNVNSLGEVESMRDGNTVTTTFTYDKVGRMRSRVETEGTVTWTYGNSATAKNIGKISQMSGRGYTETRSYDSIGRRSSTQYVADTTYQVDYAYNAANGFVDNITYPVGTGGTRLRVRYGYTNGFLTSASSYDDASIVWWRLNAQDARFNPTDETLRNGVHVLSDYDPLTGHLNSRKSGTNATFDNQQNLAYQWDKNENLAERVERGQTGTGCAVTGLCEKFGYDSLNRIGSATLNGTSTLSVGYDAAGNITSKTGIGTYTYDSVKKHAVRSTTNGWTFTYDGNGNMLTGKGANLTWRSYNRLASITKGVNTSQFSYTPNGQYWKQVANYSNGPETTIYIAGLFEKVTGSTVTDYRHYINVGSATIIVDRSTGSNSATYYATRDHLGSSAVITNDSGALILSESFDAFGARRASNWQGVPSTADWTNIGRTTRKGFTGHTMLDNVTLVHMNGRVYDPEIGRVLSPDPIVATTDLSQGLNPYSYVMNNPLRFVDPSGNSWLSKIFHGIGHFASKLWHSTTFRAVLGIAVAAFTGQYWAPLSSAGANAVLGGTLGGAVATGTAKGAFIGGLTAGLFYEAGSIAATHNLGAAGTALTHAAAGCISSAAGGGSCGKGALTAGITDFAQQSLPDLGAAGNVVKSGVIGGATSSMVGGSFAEGFTEGATGYLANQMAHQMALGRIAELALEEALHIKSPQLKIQLNRHFSLTSSGFIRTDFIVDNKYLFELKPDSWQRDPSYQLARKQIAGYVRETKLTAGEWSNLQLSSSYLYVSSALHVPNARVGRYGGWDFTGAFVFGYDSRSSMSGLLFYEFGGGRTKASGPPELAPIMVGP